MPLYEFHCVACPHSWEQHIDYEERNKLRCPKCRATATPVGGPSTVMFERGWYEHIAPEPIYCDSAKELKAACEKHDAYSPYLEASPWKRGL